MSRKFDENTRVKIPATMQFLRLGYNYQSMNGSNIDFETKIFVDRFKSAIEKINNIELSSEDLEKLLDEIYSLIRNNDLGRSFYRRLTDTSAEVKLIDFDCIENNDFAVVDELPFTVEKDTEEGSFRPDINILINGMPLAFLEVKKPNNEGGIQAEFNRMINKRLQNPAYRKFFNLIQLVTFSNNMEYENDDSDDVSLIRAGSFYSTPNGNKTMFSFFREDEKGYLDNYKYQTLDENTERAVIKDLGYNPNIFDTEEFSTNNVVTTPCNKFVTSIFDKERFIFLLHYGFLYLKAQNNNPPEKHVMRYPQFFACRALLRRLDKGQKRGIIWHTQGSGKTELAMYCNIILHDYFAKKNQICRFYFVVDRIELLRQDNSEFSRRYFSVKNAQSKKDFSRELNRVLTDKADNDSIGEFVVVNIQKFEDAIPKAGNVYNSNIQRIFFIDEAHRSYALHGTYFKNLIVCDPNAVFVALTGTPLLSKKERSNLKFGDYIHKYFYDKSIADGYTLRIKKEKINTVVKTDIKNNIQLDQSNDLNSADVYESDAYVDYLGKFIDKDFQNFRMINSDQSIGGMIVCRSNPQAKKLHKWFQKNSKLSTGLVISDEGNTEQNEANKHYQIDFKNTNKPDLLIVEYMLTTGYDVNRLKKMYLLRGPHAQNLLQTISRVNRPYKSPNGKVYHYGYITDFIDIESEYDRTLNDYLKELEQDINDTDDDENNSLNGLLVDVDTIREKYNHYAEALSDMIDTDNLEKFRKKLDLFSKETVLSIKRLLNGIRDCYIEFLVSGNMDDASKVNLELVKQKLRITQNRIDFLNLKEAPVRMMDILSDDEIVQIVYEFIKTSISVIDLGKFDPNSDNYKEFTKVITEIKHQINKNKNKDDIRMISLDQALQQLFENMDIQNMDDLDDLTGKLKDILIKAIKINEENDRLSAVYDGNFALVKTYEDTIAARPDLNNKEIEDALKLIYSEIKDGIDTDILIIQGRDGFIDETKKKVVVPLIKAKLYKKLGLKTWIETLLSNMYTNLQNYR